ncbi:PH domain-containing protein [Chitinophaga rhizophila]|uniref:PH domain-containing protein n=1 Tax=Chitinophaga rhizophila TaxID=2866212 RepID=A0ABS7GJ79_9BACT|nr:PH domain-containing protein [Chitinophaga rhizophila]MBW8687760.1 PH domain-containing protein [Chitinophaga rhizophila]
MTTYKSAVSKGIFIPVLVIFLAVIVTAAITRTWGLVGIMTLTAAFTFYTIMSIDYKITGNELAIRCGILFKRTVHINTINRIRHTHNPLSAPAASLDRLELRFNKYETILVSPKNKAAFIDQLRAINPDIDYQKKPHVAV